MMRTMRTLPLGQLALVCLTSVLGGCRACDHFLYVTAPISSNREVPAEFDGLSGHKIAVIVDADEQMQFEYPLLRLELSAAASQLMKQRVENVSLVDPRAVVNYQDSHLNWNTRPKTALAAALGADYVLYVTMIELSTREPGTLRLYRGRLVAEAGLYQANYPERRSRVWHGPDFRVTYPKHGPTSLEGDSDRRVLQRTLVVFADQLVKKFHPYEVPLED